MAVSGKERENNGIFIDGKTHFCGRHRRYGTVSHHTGSLSEDIEKIREKDAGKYLERIQISGD